MSADRTLQTSMTIGTHSVKRLDDMRTLLVDNKALFSNFTIYFCIEFPTQIFSNML
jgi:hypothetical protein